MAQQLKKPAEVGAVELCRILGVARPTINRWLKADPPLPSRQDEEGRRARWYVVADVMAWMNARGATAAQQGRRHDATVARQTFTDGAEAPEEVVLEGDPTGMPPNTLQRLIKQTDLILKREKVRKERRANEEAEGKLIDQDSVIAAHTRMVRVARNRLDNLPRSLAGRLALLTDPLEVENLLQDAINEALRSLSNGGM